MIATCVCGGMFSTLGNEGIGASPEALCHCGNPRQACSVGRGNANQFTPTVTKKQSLTEILNEIESRANAATPGPWKKCSASEGKCACHDVWSIPADAPVCACNDKWGDRFASLRFVGSDGPGTIGAKVEAYEDMIEYGDIGEDAKQANKAFIASARTDQPKLVKIAKMYAEELKFHGRVKKLAELAAILTSPENGEQQSQSLGEH